MRSCCWCRLNNTPVPFWKDNLDLLPRCFCSMLLAWYLPGCCSPSLIPAPSGRSPFQLLFFVGQIKRYPVLSAVLYLLSWKSILPSLCEIDYSLVKCLVSSSLKLLFNLFIVWPGSLLYCYMWFIQLGLREGKNPPKPAAYILLSPPPLPSLLPAPHTGKKIFN